MTSAPASPAVILRPMPYASEQDAVAGYFGGAPIMPEALSWPRNAHGVPMLFIGQVDMAMLPMEGAWPREGMLYFFWDVVSGGEAARVLFAPKSSGPVAYCEVPPDSPDLSSSETLLVFPDGLEADGKTMRKLWIEALPFQSEAGGEAPVQGLEAALGRGEYPEVEYAFPWLPNHDPSQQTEPEGMLKKLLGRVGKPTPRQAEEGFGLDPEAGLYCVPPSFPWRWSVVQDVAAQIKELATLSEGNLYEFWNGDAPPLLHLWKDAPAQADQWIARAAPSDTALSDEEADAFRGWLDQLANAALHIQVEPAPDPAVVAACQPMLEILSTERHVLYTYPAHEETAAHRAAKALVPYLACIKEYVPAVDARSYDEDVEGVYWSEDSAPVPYYEEWDAWYVPRKRLIEVLQGATQRFTQRLWRYGPSTDLPEDLRTLADWDILRATTLRTPEGETSTPDEDHCVPTQMFGHGQFMPAANLETDGKVMLFQMSDGFGLPFNMDSRVLHIWIESSDLAAGRFEASFTTID